MRTKVFGVWALLAVLGVAPGMVSPTKAELIEPPEGIEGRLGSHQSSVAAPLNLFWKYSETDDVVKLDWDSQVHSQDCTQCTMFEINNGVQTCTQWLEFEQTFFADYTVTRKEGGDTIFETSTGESSVGYDDVADSTNHAQIEYEVFSEKPDIPPINNEFFFCNPLDGSDQTSTITMDENIDLVADYVGQDHTVMGDIDGDGNFDLALRNIESGAINGLIHFWLMNDQGQIREEQPAGLNCCFFPDSFPYSILDFADMNGDGVQDIVSIGNANAGEAEGLIYSWLLNEDSSVAAGRIHMFLPEGWTLKAVVDMTGDGILDMFTMRDSDRLMYTWALNAQGGVSHGIIHGFLVSDYEIIDVVDVSGDGQPDVLSERTTDGLLYTWVVDPSDGLIRSGLNHGAQPADYEVVAVADVDQNAEADIVLHRKSDGSVLTWYSVESGTPGTTAENVVQGSGWNIMHIQDMNTDGFPDIVAQNDNDDVNIWMLDEDGEVTANVHVSAPKISEWTIQPFFFGLHNQ